MMKRCKYICFSFWFIVLALLVSCGDRPSNVLPEDKMVSLIVDMELAESYETTQSHYGHDRNEIGKRVLKAHGVSEETLDTTFAWYGRNMDKYTALFEKVDKELLKRKDKYTDIPVEELTAHDDLWPFSTHLLISPLSGSDAFVFSLPYPNIEKGEIVEISYALPNATGIKSSFGVEYKDGHGEAVTTTFNSKHHIQMSLQTDTAKEVARLFGVMHVKDIKALPIYIDSISIKTHPIDTLNYRSKHRSQKTFTTH